MAINYIYPPYEVVRDFSRCVNCKICIRECANNVHTFDEKRGIMIVDETK